MLAVISWWVLDGYCYFLLCPGWLLFFPYGPWMVIVISQQLKYLHRARTVPGTPSKSSLIESIFLCPYQCSKGPQA